MTSEKRIDLKIWTRDYFGEPCRVPQTGYLIAPGLAIVGYGNYWSITHIPSGYAVLRVLSGKSKAGLIAKELAKLGNWDMPAKEVKEWWDWENLPQPITNAFMEDALECSLWHREEAKNGNRKHTNRCRT